MNNKFGKLFDEIIAQQNEFMELLKSKKFFILQQATPSGAAPAAAAPSGAAPAAPAAPAAAAPSGTTSTTAAPAAAAPSGAAPAAAAPSGAAPATPAKPADPVTDKTDIKMRDIFIECGTSNSNQDEKVFLQYFNKMYQKGRICIIYKKANGKPGVKKIAIQKYRKKKAFYLRQARDNNKAFEDVSYLNDKKVIKYKPSAIQLLQMANPRLTPEKAEERFINKVESNMIPVVENGKINLNKDIEEFLNDFDTFEDNVDEYFENNKKAFEAAAAAKKKKEEEEEEAKKKKEEEEATAKQAQAQKEAKDKRFEEFRRKATKYQQRFPSKQVARVCDLDSWDSDDLKLTYTVLYDIAGNLVANWESNSEIDSDSEKEDFHKYLNTQWAKDASGTDALPVHPAVYAYILHNLTSNSSWTGVDKNNKQTICELYDGLRQDAADLTKEFPEFFDNAHMGKSLDSWYAEVTKERTMD